MIIANASLYSYNYVHTYQFSFVGGISYKGEWIADMVDSFDGMSSVNNSKGVSSFTSSVYMFVYIANKYEY